MKTISLEELKVYEKYIYNRARDIEIAKYNYHFNDGEREDVAMALSIYQNRDGGFGHGLEPDSLNPYSSPLQTAEALKILKHVGYDASNLDDMAEYNKGYYEGSRSGLIEQGYEPCGNCRP